MFSNVQRRASACLFQNFVPARSGETTLTGLLIDEDPVYARELQRSFEQRGFTMRVAPNAREAVAAARAHPPEFALIGSRLARQSGLDLIEPLKAIHREMRIVMITGHASITCAVEAIKRGADNYLLKPVTVDVILRALDGETVPQPEPAATMAPLNRLQWDRIDQALEDTHGNISAAARLLGIHRRSLQRKLAKRPRLVIRRAAATQAQNVPDASLGTGGDVQEHGTRHSVAFPPHT